MSSPLPTSQSDLQEGFDSLAEKPEEMDRKVAEYKAKVDSVEAPSGWQIAGEALLSAVFPIAGFYFS